MSESIAGRREFRRFYSPSFPSEQVIPRGCSLTGGTITITMSVVPPKSSFLAMDEFGPTKLGILGMVAVAASMEQAHELRHELYAKLAGLYDLPKNHIAPTVDLHAMEMLKGQDWATEDDRLACFDAVVAVVNRLRLHVYRCAYYAESLEPLRALMGKHDPKFHGLCGTGLLFMASPLSESSYIIPLLDGFDPLMVKTIAGPLQMAHSMRAQGQTNISIPRIDHHLEPVFADRKYSSLLQVVDVVAYLLDVLDYEEQNKDMPAFKKVLLPIAKKLDTGLVKKDLVWMTTRGVDGKS